MNAAPAFEPHPGPAPPRRRWLRRSLLGFLVLALAVASAGPGLWWRWTRKALTPLDGEVRVPGLAAPVTVRRDAQGVPHLEAASVADLMRAQGWITAQDRLWQMDLMRRRALGQLAEAFGEGALRADKEIRTLGLAASAREALTLVPPDLQAVLEAYAGGVNAYIDAHRDALPVEFRLLRYEPRPWEPVHSLAVGKLLAQDLAKGWESEAFRAVVGDRFPPDVQDVLFPSLFAGDRILVGRDGTTPRPAAAGPETATGSNNWVVSGAHTATGKPLLANDPHLGLTVPSIWTAVHLTAGDFDVAGVTLPGAPGVILGRNRRVAWGCTNVEDDSADLYVEQFDPAQPDRYRVGEGWERVTVRMESIRVREGALSSRWRTVEHPVRLTRHGPLVEIRGHLYALRWTALEKADELTAFALANRAGGWEDFRAALARFPGPSQNFVYADVEGHIAWYSAGRVPIRRAGDGARPYPGASADGDWVGLVPFDELPHLVDPPSGRIVTANNRLVGTDYPYRVTRGGIGPWRAATLFEALESREGWTADDMVRLQGERLSIPHRDLARALLAAAARHPGDATWDDVTRELKGWDGRLEAQSRPAALAHLTFRALGARLIGPRVKGSPFEESLSRRTVAIHRLLVERPPGWAPENDWDRALGAAWGQATTELGRTLGTDRARWTWGALNQMEVVHPLTRAVPALASLLNPHVVGMGGFSTTPNVLYISPRAVEAPSMRFVADMADPDNTRLANFMGQSGHPASPHYGDQLEAWVSVQSPRLPFTPAAVAREARHTLRLVP